MSYFTRHKMVEQVLSRVFPEDFGFSRVFKKSARVWKRELTQSQADGLWSKFSGSEHPHTACYNHFKDSVDDAHAFCARVEKMAAGTTPAERESKKK